MKNQNNGAMSFTEGSEVQLTEAQRIERLIEENKALGQMYANTFAKLRDIQKEFSDMKANLHRAYNGLENYKNLKEQLKQRDETIKQLREALKEYQEATDYSKTYQMWSPTKELDKAYIKARKLLE